MLDSRPTAPLDACLDGRTRTAFACVYFRGHELPALTRARARARACACVCAWPWAAHDLALAIPALVHLCARLTVPVPSRLVDAPILRARSFALYRCPRCPCRRLFFRVSLIHIAGDTFASTLFFFFTIYIQSCRNEQGESSLASPSTENTILSRCRLGRGRILTIGRGKLKSSPNNTSCKQPATIFLLFSLKFAHFPHHRNRRMDEKQRKKEDIHKVLVFIFATSLHAVSYRPCLLQK